MTQKYRRHPIARRLIQLMAVVGALTFILVAVLLNLLLSARLNEDISKRANTVLASLQSTLHIMGNSSSLQRMVSALSATPDVQQIIVTQGERPIIIAANKYALLGRNFETALPPDERDNIMNTYRERRARAYFHSEGHPRYEIFAPVRIKSRDLKRLEPGVIHIILNTDIQQMQIEYDTRRILFILLGGMGAMLFLLYWVTHKQVLLPILEIRSTLEKRSSGNHEAFAPVLRTDEIGEVASALNSMLAVQEEAQKELREKTQEAQAANNAKSEFLANMSHEIRTPLNGVMGIAGALEKTSMSEAQLQMVRLIKLSGETLNRLLSDILDISKIEAGKVTMDIVSFDLQEEIELAAFVLRQRADDKGVGFELSHGETARGVFLGDAVRLRQIVSNLVSNAVKFTEHGGVAIRVDVGDPDGGNGPAQVRIDVEDSGVGFDEETGKRLFKRFEQADASFTRNFGGTGLGLFIVKSLTELMGGSISFSSKAGAGSRFTVTVPFERAMTLADYDRRPAHREHTKDDVASLEQIGGLPLRVLLAEDDNINQLVAEAILEPVGVSLTVAANGREAVEAFAKGTFDIVLMDMQMPVMDGLAATRAIRAMEREQGRPRTPIVMLSANVMKEQIGRAVDAGCDGHIAKPVTPEVLINGIKSALELRVLANTPDRAPGGGRQTNDEAGKGPASDPICPEKAVA